MKVHELARAPVDRDVHVVQVRVRRTAAALLGEVPPGVVDDDLAHRARREREEVPAVVRRDALVLRESQVGLVHDGRRVQRAARSPELPPGEISQVGVDEGEEGAERGGVSGAQLGEEAGDVRLARHVVS